MNILSKILCGCLFVSCFSAQASIVLGGTRIIYSANKSEVQIALKNKDPHTRYLVQSWISYPDDVKAPFVVTPPVYKLQENRQTLLHIIYTGDKNALPNDRESLFVANVKSVSAISPELKDKNTLQFAMKTRLKLFWRPAQLKEADALQAWENITFRRQGSQLIAKNPTPFYVSFGELAVGGKAIPVVETKTTPGAISMMVAPFSEQTFTVPKGANGPVTWTAISDYGAQTRQRQQAL
ncbi:fimbrial biogenesis chaperone [Citrobacter youngae]|uniref:fimbrial biogenesis chaperone n=1 Tax=Citrobacter TaxID=544 RepID=UPI000EF1C8CB|nr:MULTISPECIES: molecular chaperone [Citrobacter]AYL60282.1 oxidoreductase [Citrobacter pasteurii]MBA8107571.1 molecular chaperone [Citrobacter sp. RHBSTW-00029]MDU5625512.1 molecular chaperone [Citrobacter sp.]NHM10474.1 molecular chaperone [Citrobacter youngae]